MSKFKVFIGRVETPGKLPKQLTKELKAFTANEKVDPKSIGVEYIEDTNELMVSLGYSERKSKINVDFKLKKIANVSDGSEKISAKMEKAAGSIESLICHEIYIDKSKDIHAIFMVEKKQA